MLEYSEHNFHDDPRLSGANRMNSSTARRCVYCNHQSHADEFICSICGATLPPSEEEFEEARSIDLAKWKFALVLVLLLVAPLANSDACIMAKGNYIAVNDILAGRIDSDPGAICRHRSNILKWRNSCTEQVDRMLADIDRRYQCKTQRQESSGISASDLWFFIKLLQ